MEAIAIWYVGNDGGEVLIAEALFLTGGTAGEPFIEGEPVGAAKVCGSLGGFEAAIVAGECGALVHIQ